LHGLFLIHEGHYAEAPAVLLTAAHAYQPFDVLRARSILLDAVGAACLAGDRAVGTSPRDLAREALATPRPAGATPTMADLLLDGTATRLAAGYADAAPTLRAALQSSVTDEAPTANIALWSMLGTYAALELLDDTALQSWVTAIERHARDSGSITLLRGVLLDLGTAAGLAGRFDDADSFNNELRQLNLISDAPAHMDALIDVELLGLQGRDAEGRAAARILQQAAVEMGFQAAHNRGLLARVRLDLAAGNYADALAAGNELADNPALGIGCIVIPDIVEAGARSGDIPAATDALDRFTERADVSGTPWALGLLARCRALLAPVSYAKEQYEESLQQLGKTSMAFDLARTHLVYGERLRREGQRIDARDQLRAAMKAFASMGASGFAERARSELIATGERARRRTVDTARDLTPQERQIAEMAAHRDTNREIATRLFISASTVDYHLRNVYRKLGINSRRHLEQALGGI
jgi:DNA-binding CsgD family transcriptional regulator